MNAGHHFQASASSGMTPFQICPTDTVYGKTQAPCPQTRFSSNSCAWKKTTMSYILTARTKPLPWYTYLHCAMPNTRVVWDSYVMCAFPNYQIALGDRGQIVLRGARLLSLLISSAAEGWRRPAVMDAPQSPQLVAAAPWSYPRVDRRADGASGSRYTVTHVRTRMWAKWPAPISPPSA